VPWWRPFLSEIYDSYMGPLYNDHSCYTSVNFVKNLGSGGNIGNGLRHYRIEIDSTSGPRARDALGFDALDGNGQLFLCLQDLAMDSFTNGLTRALDGQKRNTVLIVVSDEVSSLRNPRSTSPSPSFFAHRPLILDSSEPFIFWTIHRVQRTDNFEATGLLRPTHPPVLH